MTFISLETLVWGCAGILGKPKFYCVGTLHGTCCLSVALMFMKGLFFQEFQWPQDSEEAGIAEGFWELWNTQVEKSSRNDFFLSYSFNNFLCTLVFCLHVCQGEDVRSSGTGVTDGCEPPCGCWVPMTAGVYYSVMVNIMWVFLSHLRSFNFQIKETETFLCIYNKT